jgi:deoxyribonuclease V
LHSKADIHTRMEISLQHSHDWDVSPEEAKQIQRRLESEVTETPLPDDVDTVAGVDVSIRDDTAQAAVAVLELPDLEVVDEAIHRCEVPFPYVPGLLSFRETPPVLSALEQLAVAPDVLMTDSHGRAHPRRFGFACHLGVLLDCPTLGVAKSILVGTPQGGLDPEKGSRVPLVDDGETIGRVLRTRTDVNPVYVSVGHRITLDAAVALTLDCSPRYKIPEPTRQAHRLSRTEA